MRLLRLALFFLTLVALPLSANAMESYWCDDLERSEFEVACGELERDLAIRREMEFLPTVPAHVVGYLKSTATCALDHVRARGGCVKLKIRDFFREFGRDLREELARYKAPPGVGGIRIDIAPKGYRRDDLDRDDVLKLLRKPGS